MGIFINGIGSIGPQIFLPRQTDLNFEIIESNPLLCIEPDYSAVIAPMQLRRMSKAVRMGIASALNALKDAGKQKPDEISLGTAYGCLADTEFFLKKLIQQEEQMLTPTAFIQSTHNTVSGQIALFLSCYGRNFTFSHRGHSFEHALQDAIMSLAENSSRTILAGGIDEISEHSYKVIQRFGTYKKENENIQSETEGCFPGEGSNMFVLSTEQNDLSYAEILGVETCKAEHVDSKLKSFLEKNGIQTSEIDTLLLGENFDTRYELALDVSKKYCSEAAVYYFKKYCGEHPVTSSFALLMASNILRYPIAMNPDKEGKNSRQLALIHNHYKNQYHSFILLRKV